ncbi:MAG: hypothetical protein J2O46_01090, partial [Nocardioides sp.]|nr:hypothetical protein [Nocardioides sp.]
QRPTHDPTPSRPLFADETPGYVEPPRTPQPARRAVVPDATFSNWDGSWTGANVAVAEEPDYVEPGRNWVRLAMSVGVVVLLLVAGSIAFNVLTSHDDTPAADQPGSKTASQAPDKKAATAPAETIRGITAQDFDPYGDPPTESSDIVGNAVDGHPDTSWRTMTYLQQFGPGGLKPGLGLVLDLKGEYAVNRIKLDLVGQPTGISVYVGDSPWTHAPKGAPAGSNTLGTSGDVVLNDKPEGSYVLVWITKMPQVPAGFRAEINEVQVVGSEA